MQPNNSSAYLIIRQGHRWTDVFRLEPSRPLIVGRASSNEIPVADERSSRRHAEIFYSDGKWIVRDLGSRNGTFVDGNRIESPLPLYPGAQITVASCRMTFAHSLDEIVPAVETEDGSPKTTSQTQDDINPAIVHRKSKASILDSQAIEMPNQVNSPQSTYAVSPSPPLSAAPQAMRSNTAPIAIELLQLAFDLAKQPSVTDACELALNRLLATVNCQTGGILKFESTVTQRSKGDVVPIPVVVAARERSGRAYHPVNDTLIATVRRDASAILARNVSSDQHLMGGNASQSNASHVHSTTSIIVAPLRIRDELIGLIHLYSRVGERELMPDDLEVTLAVADVLAVSLDNLYRQQSLETKLNTSRSRISELEKQLGQTVEWVGPSTSMIQVREQVQRVAPTQATVLIRGESGVGKELVARAIHDASSRASGPFVAINCAALSPTLLESELFGHEKGSFTGATDRKLGKFEQAHTGSIMLDELGEMSMEIQAKFLRVLEGKSFERVGGGKPIQVDVRVIAATNRDLEQAVKDGEFRSDLYFRLRVIELRVPPLRQRPEDVVPLAEYFLKQFTERSGHGPKGFSRRAIDAMTSYDWPGNVRELKNSVERAFVLASGELAEPEDLALSYIQLPGQPNRTATTFAAPVYREKTIEEIEQEHILATLEYTGGQKNRAAAILGIERSTLDRKLKKSTGN